jgi:hypothetical protein
MEHSVYAQYMAAELELPTCSESGVWRTRRGGRGFFADGVREGVLEQTPPMGRSVYAQYMAAGLELPPCSESGVWRTRRGGRGFFADGVREGVLKRALSIRRCPRTESAKAGRVRLFRFASGAPRRGF